MTTIVNGAPMTLFRGTDDQSTRALLSEPENLPTHLPMVYGYAKKGPLDPQLVAGSSRSKMYGEESFDMRAPWATHTTELSNTFTAEANAQMFQRLKPLDAGPNATIRLYADVITTQLTEYERNVDGSFKLDADGLKIPTGSMITGVRTKWIATQVLPDLAGDDTFGIATQAPGDQTDGATQSVRYPIMDLRAPYFGADGNNYGLRIWAPTQQGNNPVDGRLLANQKVYPFRMAVVYRKDDLSSAQLVDTMTGEKTVNVTFRPETIDKNTDAKLYLGDVFLQAYQDFQSRVNPPVYGPFGEMHVYDANVKAIAAMVLASEEPYIDENHDITGAAGEEYLVNLIGGVSSSGVPYYSYELVESGANVVRLSENSTIYAQGGSDGTMSEALMANLVITEMAAYADENSPLMDDAKYPQSIIYDTGFPLATKYALCSFIAVRKDTAVVLSTHDVLGRELTAAEENSLAIALRTRLQMYPESEYFGTSTMRGMIIPRSGRKLNTQYGKHLPLTHEVARNSARYMGASNGRWKPGFAFDSAPQAVVTGFTDINVTYTSASVRNKDWDVGLVGVLTYQRRSVFFPAMKTVYNNDTSVLNSFFTMMACVELQKVGARAWRRFSGTANLTNAQLADRVANFIRENTVGRFDDRFVIEPEVYFTAADIARGYSWSTRIRIRAANMKTVQTLSLEARRLDEAVPA